MPASIGKYLVVGRLDGGGQADVYRVVHPRLAKELILKWARSPGFGRESEPGRLVAEGKLLAGLAHPSLVPIVDLDFADDRPFLVMEYVRGCHLQQAFDEHRSTPRKAAEWVSQVARAVAVAHRIGIFHLDIKPKNILIDESGRARLIDFGMARMRDAYSSEPDPHGGGTLAYMAPEQARSEIQDVGPRSDVFSLGGVLYFLLTGKAPYQGSDLKEVWHRARQADFDRSALRSTDIPGRLQRIVLRAMEAEPAGRFASADDLADQLEAYSRRPRRIALAAGLVGSVAMVAGLAWWMDSAPISSPATPALEPHSILRIRRGTAIFGNICEAKGLETGDRIRVRCDVPSGLIPVIFWLDSEGKLEQLGPVEVSPRDRGERWVYPGNGMDAPLAGSTGTEMVLICGLRSGTIRLDEVEKALGGSRPLPPLPPQVRMLIDRDQVDEHIERTGRGPGEPESSPVGDAYARLEKLRLALRDRCPYLLAAAFTHRQPEHAPSSRKAP